MSICCTNPAPMPHTPIHNPLSATSLLYSDHSRTSAAIHRFCLRASSSSSAHPTQAVQSPYSTSRRHKATGNHRRLRSSPPQTQQVHRQRQQRATPHTHHCIYLAGGNSHLRFSNNSLTLVVRLLACRRLCRNGDSTGEGQDREEEKKDLPPPLLRSLRAPQLRNMEEAKGSASQTAYNHTHAGSDNAVTCDRVDRSSSTALYA